MRVGQRLFLAVLPAVLGVLTVAGLAYWGRPTFQAPEWLVVIAVVAATLSLVVAWANTRYVAKRIERLAARVESGHAATPASALRRVVEVATTAIPGRSSSPNAPDELDAIESTVDRLSTAVADAAAERDMELERLAERRREYGDLVAHTSQTALEAIDEIRLPLHILLENRFGDLNENQEEMLGAARTAAEKANMELKQLRDIADFDRGAVTPRMDVVRVGEVLRSLSPMLIAEGERRSIAPRIDVAPGLPHVIGDRRHIQEAVSAVLLSAIRRAPEGSDFAVSTEHDRQAVRILVSHAGGATPSVESAFARRLLTANGATLGQGPGGTSIDFPRGRGTANPV